MTSTSNPTRSATLTLTEVSMEGLLGCQAAARMADAHDPADALAAPQLLTDPVRKVASLHLCKHVTTAHVSLSDAQGHLLRQWVMAGADLDIALDALAAGLYFVSVMDGNRESTLKLSVQ